MKTRNGFVSNSSSSSFVIYGVQLEHDTDFETEQKLSDAGLQVEYGEYGEAYAGLLITAEHEHSYCSGIDESIPLDIQKQNAVKNLTDIFGKEFIDNSPIDTYYESFYNG